jgi:TonB family protein
LHEEIPQVSRGSRDTIHGRIRVTVRVTVNGAGDVVHETLEYPGPSKYFARQASAAAQKWKFGPASAPDSSREALIEFGFNRWGTTGHATLR